MRMRETRTEKNREIQTERKRERGEKRAKSKKSLLGRAQILQQWNTIFATEIHEFDMFNAIIEENT